MEGLSRFIIASDVFQLSKDNLADIVPEFVGLASCGAAIGVTVTVAVTVIVTVM
jgi:hypothetical protein